MALDRGVERPRGLPFEKVLAELVTRAAYIKDAPQSYRIEGDIDPAQLRPLVSLPFETTITEHQRHFILHTGTEDYMHSNPDPNINDREITSQLWFHAHGTKLGVVFDAPSLFDLRTATMRSKNPRLSNPIIAHKDGLIVFSVRQQQFDATIKEIGQWLEAHSALSDEESGPTEHSLRLESEMGRELAEKMGAIIFETTWEKKAGIERIGRTFNRAIE